MLVYLFTTVTRSAEASVAQGWQDNAVVDLIVIAATLIFIRRTLIRFLSAQKAESEKNKR